MFQRRRPLDVRRIVPPLTALCLATFAAGCATRAPADLTGAIAREAPPQSASDWRRESEAWAARYAADQKDPVAAFNYARALRAGGQHAQATAVLEQTLLHNPRDTKLLGAYGRALADTGHYKQSLDVFSRAHAPDQPDWRILSAQGAVLDQMGRHGEAQRYYASALKIVPNEASVLSNLGLSYALAKNLPLAEKTLRTAVAQRDADQRVRQNLALVVGLQGRFAEAETIARADLPPETAAANAAYLKQMLAKPNDWKKRRHPTVSEAPSGA
ncbi:MAG: hypothetical protein HY056_08365 [Proteobacteria bacterium]|nr:hypothetical protein [Pseudomonadota bacterium]